MTDVADFDWSLCFEFCPYHYLISARHSALCVPKSGGEIGGIARLSREFDGSQRSFGRAARQDGRFSDAVESWKPADQRVVLLDLAVSGSKLWIEQLGLARPRPQVANAASIKRELLLDRQVVQVQIVLRCSEDDDVVFLEVV